MVRLLSNILFFIILSTPAWATTYFIRTDGGTNTQCTGTTDAAYSSGSAQPCGLNSPQWVFPPDPGDSQSTKAGSGDTVVIDGLDQGGTGQYKIGCQNAFNCRDTTVNQGTSSHCDSTYPYQCTMGSIPSNITLIGCTPSGCGCNPTYSAGTWSTTCTHPRPQLWGAGIVTSVVSLASASSNQNVQDIEITDHAACAYRIGAHTCTEDDTSLAAQQGLNISNSSNFTLKNLWIHGVGHEGLYGHTTGGAVFDNVNIDKNPNAGWNSDDGSGVSGTVTWQNHSKITYSGCSEAYPLTGLTSNTRNDILNCTDSNHASTPGYGDGIGTANGTAGTWIFKDSEVSHNVQDGIDILHSDGSGSLTLFRTKVEGNNANGVKSSLLTNYIENSQIIGNCDYFTTAGITLDSSFVTCRGNASQPIAITGSQGQVLHISNSSIYGDYDVLVDEGSTGSAQSCDGTESFLFKNNIMYGSLNYGGGGLNSASWYCGGSDGNGTGACCTGVHTITPTLAHEIVFNTKDTPTGTSMSYTEPHITQGDGINTGPNTDTFNFNLTASSTNAIGNGDNSISLQGTSNDYNNFSRASSWDIGSLQNGSSPPCLSNGSSCSLSSSCCSLLCNANSCIASGTINMSLPGNLSIRGSSNF